MVSLVIVALLVVVVWVSSLATVWLIFAGGCILVEIRIIDISSGFTFGANTCLMHVGSFSFVGNIVYVVLSSVKCVFKIQCIPSVPKKVMKLLMGQLHRPCTETVETSTVTVDSGKRVYISRLVAVSVTFMLRQRF